MPLSPPIKNLVFDFDGTLADSFDAVCRIGMRLAREVGVSAESPPVPEALRGKSTREVIRELGIPLRSLPGWVNRVRTELKAEVPNLRPFPGVPEALHTLRERGVVLAIMSSNSRENITAFLKNHDLDGVFAGLHTSSHLFGKSRSLRQLLRKTGMHPKETAYAGDEVRDIEAARKAELRAVAVSWGFNSRELLARHHPDFLVDRPRQLHETIPVSGAAEA